MAVMIIVFFISFFIMSAVINTQVILKDVRETNIEDIKKAVAHGMRLDENETNMMYQMFNINLNKLYEMNSENLKNMNNIEIHFIECELLLKKEKKIKLMMMSLEEFLSHEAIINAKFEYDVPQQRIWNEIQNYLNELSASNGLNQVL